MRDPGTPTAIVTGASRGIGATVAQRLAANGYTVAMPGRDELDLSDLAAVREWSEAFEHTPDALVLNAGENLPELLAGGFEVIKRQVVLEIEREKQRQQDCRRGENKEFSGEVAHLKAWVLWDK